MCKPKGRHSNHHRRASCGTKCGKSVLLSFTLVHALAGGAFLVLGSSILMNPVKLQIFHFVTFDTLEREYGLYLAYTLLSIGGAVFVMSWAGCCGAIKDNSCLLGMYWFSLLLLIIVEMSISGVTMYFRQGWLDGLQDRLRSQLVQNYGNHSTNDKYLTFSETMDLIQYKFSCCGITDHQDYQQSTWLKKLQGSQNLSVFQKNYVPLTCCVLKSPLEPRSLLQTYTANAGSPINTLLRDTPHGTVEELWQTPNVENSTRCQQPKETQDFMLRHVRGCHPGIHEWFQKESTILITVGFSTSILQMAGMVLTYYLCRHLSDDI